MLILGIIAWLEQINWWLVGFVTGLYALSLISFFSYAAIRRSDVTNSLLKRRFIGVFIRILLSLRKFLKAFLLAVPLYPIKNPDSEELKDMITDSFLVIIMAISSIWIYAYLFFKSNGAFNNYTSFSAINHGNLMKAIGSLFLAFEAVLVASYQISNHNTQAEDDGRFQLKQHVRQYSLRFSGAMLLAGGYGFFILSALYHRMSEVIDLPEPVWILLFALCLMISLERALANFLAFLSLTLLLISVTAIWYIYAPIAAIAALFVAFVVYLYVKKHLNYPGFSRVITESVKKSDPT